MLMCNQYESQSVTTNDILWTNKEDCSKGEGPAWNEDPPAHEKKDYNSAGSARARRLTRGDKQYWSLQNNDKQH